jgi:hypothetical protein
MGDRDSTPGDNKDRVRTRTVKNREELGVRDAHHNPVAVPGVQSRLTDVGDLRKLLSYGPPPPVTVNRRIRDGPENHGVPSPNAGSAASKLPASSGKGRNLACDVKKPPQTL